MVHAVNNALKLPEILQRIRHFITLKDAVACARVCRGWAEEFVSVIWHTIDFAVYTELHKLDTTILEKYGHHIRVVKGVKEYSHFRVLIFAHAVNLKELSINLTTQPDFHGRFYDLLRGNSSTIENLSVIQAPDAAAPFLTFDALVPTTTPGATCRLTGLTLHEASMTRDSFSSLLRNCPSLDSLDIQSTNLLSWPLFEKSTPYCYQHPGLRKLVAPIKQVFRMDKMVRQTKKCLSLLVHFPNLNTWRIRCTSVSTTLDVPVEELRDEVAKHCPSLKILWTETHASPTANILARAFDNLTTIRVKHDQLSMDVLMAILTHQATLVSFSTYSSLESVYDLKVIPLLEINEIEIPSWAFQLLPRSCTQLTTLRLPFYEMNMDDVEKGKWTCDNLENLYVRIQGLETWAKTNRAIQMWRDARSLIRKIQIHCDSVSTSNSSQLGNIILKSDNSIEARVVRHLLKFKKLRYVWLG